MHRDMQSAPHAAVIGGYLGTHTRHIDPPLGRQPNLGGVVAVEWLLVEIGEGLINDGIGWGIQRAVHMIQKGAWAIIATILGRPEVFEELIWHGKTRLGLGLGLQTKKKKPSEDVDIVWR